MAKWKPSFTLDHDLRTDPEMVRALVNVAENVAAHARRIAPVGPDRKDRREHYKDSISVDVRTGTTGRKRVAVRTNAIGNILEGGTSERHTSKGAARGRVKPQRVLRKAARAAGLKFRATRKRR